MGKKEYKIFDWDISSKVTLDEFIVSLEDNDWDVVDVSPEESSTVIICERPSQIFSNPFSEN